VSAARRIEAVRAVLLESALAWALSARQIHRPPVDPACSVLWLRGFRCQPTPPEHPRA
jgi:hypothetical protein